MSKLPRTRPRPTWTVLVNRMSTWLSRSSKYWLGSTRKSVVTPVGPEDRSRPRLALTSALETVYWPEFVASPAAVKNPMGGPGTLWNVALTPRSQKGSGYAPDNLNCGKKNGGTFLQNCCGASPLEHSVTGPPPLVPPRSRPPRPNRP